MMINRLILGDCMDIMAKMPDKSNDLCITDPPYGIERFKKGSLRFDKIGEYQNGLKWDSKPTQEYFSELFRISKYQIIWGANNFTLPESEYFIIWDKHQTVKNFASAEMAYTNIKQPAQIFRYSIHKHNQIDKIHPTQKPVALYKWLLQNYAKPNDKIFDSHSGSGSLRIACHDLGFDLVSCELDPDYYRDNEARYQKHIQQIDLFSPEEIQKNIYKEGELWK